MPKTIQVRDVPDDVHRRLTERAGEQRLSLSEYVRADLVQIAGRPTMREMLARIERQPVLEIPESAAEAVRQERPGPADG